MMAVEPVGFNPLAFDSARDNEFLLEKRISRRVGFPSIADNVRDEIADTIRDKLPDTIIDKLLELQDAMSEPSVEASPEDFGYTATAVGPYGSTYSIEVTGETEEEASQDAAAKLRSAVFMDRGEEEYVDLVSVTAVDIDGDGETDSYDVKLELYFEAQGYGGRKDKVVFSTRTYNVTLDSSPVHGGRRLQVDDSVDGATPHEFHADAHTEAVFDQARALLAVTEGEIPEGLSISEYVAFVFGFSDLGDLTLTPEWEAFAAQVEALDSIEEIDTLDFAVFDAYFAEGNAPDGALGVLVSEAFTLQEFMVELDATFDAEGPLALDNEKFEEIYAGTAPISTTTTERRRLNPVFVVGGGVALLDGSVGSLSALAAGASGSSSAALLGLAAAAAPYVVAAVVVGAVIFGAVKLWQNYKDKNGDLPQDPQINGGTHGADHRVVHLSEGTQSEFARGGASAAADVLYNAESNGMPPNILHQTLDELPPNIRSAVLAEFRTRTAAATGEPVNYFAALQTGHNYSFLEDVAYEEGSSTRGALHGFTHFKTSDPSVAGGFVMRGSTDLAVRLQQVTPDVAARLISMWVRDLGSADVPSASVLNATLTTLQSEAPAGESSAIMTRFREIAPMRFDALIETLETSRVEADLDLAADMVGSLSVVERVDYFQDRNGIGGTAELQTFLGAGNDTLFNATSSEEKGETIVYLSGIGAAEGLETEFLALDTAAERAAFLANVSPTLSEGSAAKSITRAELLLSLDSIEAAEVVALLETDVSANTLDAAYNLDNESSAAIIVEMFENDNLVFSFDDPAKHLLGVFKKRGPQKSAEIVVDLDLRLSFIKGKKKEGLEALTDSGPLWMAVKNYTLTLGSNEADFVSALTSEEAADHLAALPPEQAAAVLDKMIADGDVEKAAEILDLIAGKSPERAAERVEAMTAAGAASILDTMDLSDAVEVAVLLSDNRIAEILFEMETESVPGFFSRLIEAYNSAGRTVTDPPADASAGMLTEEQQSEVTNESVIELPDGTEEATGTIEIEGEDVPVVEITTSQGDFLESGQYAVVPVDIDGIKQYRIVDENGDIIQDVAVVPPATAGGGWYAMTLPTLARAGRVAARAVGRFRGVGAPVFGTGNNPAFSPTGSTSTDPAFQNFGMLGSSPITYPPNGASYSTTTTPTATLTELTGLLELDPATLTRDQALRIISLTDSLRETPEEGNLTRDQKVAILEVANGPLVTSSDLSDDFWAVTGTTSTTTLSVWPPEAGAAVLEETDAAVAEVLSTFGGELEDWDDLTTEQREDLTKRIYSFLKQKFSLDFLPDVPNFVETGGAGGFRGETDGSSTFSVSPGFLATTTPAGVVGVLVHEMTHARQFDLIRQLDAGTLTEDSPFYEWAVLLRASNQHFTLEGGIGTGHPDYTSIWEETSAFRAGDQAATAVSEYFELPYFVELRLPGGGSVLYRGGAGNLDDSRYVPDSFRYGLETPPHWIDQSALEAQFGLHGADFPGHTAAEYGDGALTLFYEELSGAIIETTNDGETIRLNTETGEFAIRDSDGAITTYFVADPADHGWDTNREFFDNFGRNKGDT